ncbi:MAG: exodeoxyribonuclease VII small subunit [Spirochaetes bacterium]|nr:exodeoxyribonuclease VII small subunit [Spirochaetota bacterium]
MKDFETRLKRLEELAEAIKDQDLPLEEAITVFEEGIKLSKSLGKELERIQGKVEILLGSAEEGAFAEREDFNPQAKA